MVEIPKNCEQREVSAVRGRFLQGTRSVSLTRLWPVTLVTSNHVVSEFCCGFCTWVAPGWFVAGRPSISCISWAQCLPTLLCLAARLSGPQAQNQSGLVRTCLFCPPWLGDALDKKHGFEAALTGSDPSDVVRVSDWLGRGARYGKQSRCPLGTAQRAGRTHIRCPHSCSRRIRNCGCNSLRFDATQDYARSAEATEFCKQHGLQVSTRFNPRDLGDCAAGILSRATDINFFMNVERAWTPCADGFFSTLKAAFMEPSEFTHLASTLEELLVVEVKGRRRVFHD